MSFHHSLLTGLRRLSKGTENFPGAVLYGADDQPLHRARTLHLTSAAPVPGGSDIVTAAGAAVAGADLDIRNTVDHDLFIPVQSGGYADVALAFDVGVSFGQTLAMSVFAAKADRTPLRVLRVATFAAGIGPWLIQTRVGTPPASGFGGQGGGHSIGAGTTYCYPELPLCEAIIVRLRFSSAPVAGTLALTVIRAR